MKGIQLRPYIWLHSDAAPLMRDCGCGERCWQVESQHRSDGTTEWGGTFATFEEALVYARMLWGQEELFWTIGSCWCGWTRPGTDGSGNYIAAHVIAQHPEHQVVRG